MRDLLLKQFEYDLWANKLWLEFLSETETSEAYGKIMQHILGAQLVWVTRIEGESMASIPTLSVEDSTLEGLNER